MRIASPRERASRSQTQHLDPCLGWVNGSQTQPKLIDFIKSNHPNLI
ncbi:hypothetical protein NSTCB13_06972 [Nostoc sp. DSM 114160]|jgi:hypothetical protein